MDGNDSVSSMPLAQFKRRRLDSINRILARQPEIVVTRNRKPLLVALPAKNWAYKVLYLQLLLLTESKLREEISIAKRMAGQTTRNDAELGQVDPR